MLIALWHVIFSYARGSGVTSHSLINHELVLITISLHIHCSGLDEMIWKSADVCQKKFEALSYAELCNFTCSFSYVRARRSPRL